MNKNKMNYSLTNKDIEKFLGPDHIIKYSELSKYDDIDDVFLLELLFDRNHAIQNDLHILLAFESFFWMKTVIAILAIIFL